MSCFVNINSPECVFNCLQAGVLDQMFPNSLPNPEINANIMKLLAAEHVKVLEGGTQRVHRNSVPFPHTLSFASLPSVCIFCNTLYNKPVSQ
jgi:hypothetical protein